MDEIYARVLVCSSPSSAGSRTPDYFSLESPPHEEEEEPKSIAPIIKSVQVKIELGHRANFRKKVSVEGFTHDWVVFVRGPEGSNLQHFVDRVIFHLHDSFPKPKRVVKEPPYQVAESGYAGFMLPIEIWFRNKEEPRKIAFNYDLFLHADGHPPVNHIRCEKLTFQNPTEDFRRKLIKAGGVGIVDPPEHTVARHQNNSPPGSISASTVTKQTSAVTAPSTITTSAPAPSVSVPESRTFTELFGAPLTKPDASKKSKSQSQSQSQSQLHSVSKGKGVGGKPRSILGNNERLAAAASNGSAPSTPSKDSRDKVPTPPKDHHEKSSKGHRDKHLTPPKDSRSKNKERSSTKRSADSSPPVEAKKKRRDDDHSESRKEKSHDHERSKSKHSSKEQRKHHKSSKREKESKSEGKESSRHDSGESKKTEHKDKDSRPRDGGKRPALPPVPQEVIELSDNEGSDLDNDIKPLPPSPRSHDDSPGSRPASPASSLSFASSHHASSGPLSMLAEIDQMGHEAPPLSPLSKSSPPHLFSKSDNAKHSSKSSPRTSSKSSPKVSNKSSPKPAHKNSSPKSSKHVTTKAPSPQRKSPRHTSPKQPSPKHTPPKPLSSKHSPKENKKHSSPKTPTDSKSNRHREKENIKSKAELKFNYKESKERRKSPNKGSDDREKRTANEGILEQKASNGEYFSVLVELQSRLMCINDRDLLKKIVTLIQSTGNYKVGSTTFDFDLCSLDGGTVNQIRTCLETVS